MCHLIYLRVKSIIVFLNGNNSAEPIPQKPLQLHKGPGVERVSTEAVHKEKGD